MNMQALPEINTAPANPLEHPAVLAWNLLHSRAVEPQAIQLVKLRTKSAVYRLAGAGPDGATVIAKRCLAGTAAVERMIYEAVLPSLAVPALAYYGFAEEARGEYGWLFMEDAGGQEYSPKNQEHRVAASRWLAAVHSLELDGPVTGRLPDRSTAHYLELARRSLATVQEHLANPVMNDEDLAVLQSVAAGCQCVISRWSEVEEFYRGRPESLVHGDLVVKNVSMRSTPTGLSLLVFDWENAGWGVPGVDLAQFTGRTISPDLAIYAANLRREFRRLTDVELRQVPEIGRASCRERV